MARTSATPKSDSRAWPAVVFLLVSLVLFGGVVYYVGGLPGVLSLVEQVWSPADGGGAANASLTPTITIDAAAMNAAKLTYAEQIESQEALDHLADGDVKSFTVDSVKSDGESALVRITARFRDDSRAPGELRFVHRGQIWYFVTISGLRAVDTNRLADLVNPGRSISPTATPDEKLADVGVKKPDQGVLQTIAQQQIINQPVVRDLIAGEYSWYELGRPVPGSRTFTIPITFGGSEETTIAGRIILLAVHTEGKDRLFITTLSQD